MNYAERAAWADCMACVGMDTGLTSAGAFPMNQLPDAGRPRVQKHVDVLVILGFMMNGDAKYHQTCAHFVKSM